MQEIYRSLPLAITILREHAMSQLRGNLPKQYPVNAPFYFYRLSPFQKDFPSTYYNIQILSCILIKKQLFNLYDLQNDGRF